MDILLIILIKTPKPKIICHCYHHHQAFYLSVLSLHTDTSKHMSSQNHYISLQQFHFSLTFTRLWTSYFLNTLLIADLNSRRRNYDCFDLSNFLWIFSCRCCRCGNYRHKMRHLSSKFNWTLKKSFMSPHSACCHQMLWMVNTAALYLGGLTLRYQPRDWLSW